MLPATIPSAPGERAVVGHGLSGRNRVGLMVFASLLSGLLAAISSAAAGDGSAGSDNTAARYSTGKSGSRLTWLSQRPEAAQSDEAVESDAENSITQVQYASPLEPRRSARVAQSLKPMPDPLGDPFGDRKPITSAPAAKIGRGMLTTMPSEPKADGSLSPVSPEMPTAPKMSPTGVSPYGSSTDSAALGDAKSKDGYQPSTKGRDIASQNDVNEVCPSPKDLKKIGELTTNITPSEGELPHDCPLGDAVFQPRAFAPLTYTWTASGLCHKPLYFEDVQLERYGHMWGPLLQPLMSGAHFFLTVPILPYKMGLEPPNECIYTLGYYRPGDCAPYLLDPLPLSVRATLFEASAWAAGAVIIP
jgi:hypothetical protein